MARKTFEIKKAVELANSMLRTNRHETFEAGVAARDAICLFIEHILHNAGSYQGFRYLAKHELPDGVKPGINYESHDDGSELPCKDYNARFYNTDSSRREYFCNH